MPPPTVAALPVASPVASPVAAEGPPPLQRLRIGNTGGSGANLRGEPSPQSERIKLLLDGALVDLVDPGQEIAGTVWREIRDETGATGWISAEFLVPVTAVEIRVSPLPISSGGPPAQAGATGTRVPPIDRLTCPESHPVKAVGVGGLRYYPSTHGQYAETAPDVCLSTVEAAEALGFRRAT
ncbi:MAG: SH3 domain-containing protein [Chloroflexota bacterium]